MDMADRLVQVEDGEITMFGIKGAEKWLLVDERKGTLNDAPIEAGAQGAEEGK
jgi:hypothetical protein